MKTHTHPLKRTYIRFLRSFVSDGQWARLIAADRGMAASLLPVLALVCHGDASKTCVYSKSQMLRDCRFTAEELEAVIKTLTKFKLIQELPERNLSKLRYQIAGEILATANNKGFVLPGHFVSSRQWAGLTWEERVVLFALASATPQRTRVTSLEDLVFRLEFEIGEEDNAARDQFTMAADPPAELDMMSVQARRAYETIMASGSIQEVEGDYDSWFDIRRFGPVWIDDVARHTGLSTAKVLEVLNRQLKSSTQLFCAFGTAEPYWILLPDDVWGLAPGLELGVPES